MLGQRQKRVLRILRIGPHFEVDSRVLSCWRFVEGIDYEVVRRRCEMLWVYLFGVDGQAQAPRTLSRHKP